MWISKLFRKPNGIDRTEEPRSLPRNDGGASAREMGRAAWRHETIDSDRRSAAIEDESFLTMLGSRLHAGDKVFEPANERDSPAQDVGSLLGALYVHYCKALETPYELPSGTWTTPGSGNAAELRRDAMADSAWDREAGGAITGMFPDIENLEDAFGLRFGARGDVVQSEGIPEILRLFAPRDYEMSARPVKALPPALTRREHHTLAIDSPLAELNASAYTFDE
ncbi:TagK domain-containing protein [Paraburkholderia acidisoli]|uniref:TagK domain-containing protein n=1 Tax=Paraburkholderia acidisoli TaxID=2571748 RepID=A0A7Z2JHH9_9BURK|nr:TagK domain-containing protein [Paraburkholderia acidisoli]QGZ64088.1 TagK domain-containing protein [Paraburkholderia acidisoli]